jgi:hypothetical protein
LIGSDIVQTGTTIRDTGATVWADYEMNGGWRQQWIGMHFGNDLEINDAGYLSRNSTNYLHWQINRRFTDLSADSRYASKDWRGRVSTNYNDHGQRLGNQLRISRESRLRNGSYEYAQINFNGSGVDDLLTRGHGVLNLPRNFRAYAEYQRPRKGNWGLKWEAEIFGGGLAGNDEIGYLGLFEPTYFVNDALNVFVGVEASRTPDWLVWQHDNLIGSFDSQEANLNAGLHWTITSRQELRLRLQAIGLSATLNHAYRVNTNGDAVPTDEFVEDFSVRNLGLQIRYRYELAPLSYLYIVYGRGGYEEDPMADGSSRRSLRDAFSLRNDDQLLVKFSYRFET